MAWQRGGTSARTTTTDWRRLRVKILDRDGRRCTVVEEGERCAAPAVAVDHIVNVAAGGTDHPSNLASICQPHHDQKTQAEAKAARQKQSLRREPERHPGVLR